jgi:uncharacterized protein (TIGR02118 family)
MKGYQHRTLRAKSVNRVNTVRYRTLNCFRIEISFEGQKTTKGRSITFRVNTVEGKSVIKLVYCITKKPSLTDAEFFHYWRHIHGPIGARIPGLRRLVQSHRLTLVEDNNQPDYDGIAELWFDDLKSLSVARESAAWKTSTEDEANFIDPTKVAYVITEEHVVFDGAQPGKH